MPSGSSPFAGSSNTSTLGLPSSASATARRCFIPSDRLPTEHLGHSGEPDDREHLAHPRADPTPTRLADLVRCFDTVLRRARSRASSDDPRRRSTRRAARCARYSGSADRRATARGAQLAEQHAQRRGLAGAVRAEERGSRRAPDRPEPSARRPRVRRRTPSIHRRTRSPFRRSSGPPQAHAHSSILAESRVSGEIRAAVACGL